MPETQPIQTSDLRDTLAAMVRHAATGLPEDFLRALRFGFDREKSPLGRGIYRQLLTNAAEASAAGRPTCQDTGQAVLFVEVGQDVRLVGEPLEEALQAGVALGYESFRKSIVSDPLYVRRNTRDNTPAILHTRIVPGRTVSLALLEKGYGSENKSFMRMHPSPFGGEEAVLEYVLELIGKAGADWCPPGMLSIAVGGNFEAAPRMAKQALLQPFDMDILLDRSTQDPGSLSSEEKFRIRLFEEVNRLGIGPQGLGGVTTVLDVKLVTAPTHIAGLPIAVSVQCNKAHHLEATLDGSGPVLSFPRADPSPYLLGLDDEVLSEPRRLTLPLDETTRRSLRAGERVLLSGRLLTARDAAHKKIFELLDRAEALPVDLRGQLLYYVGPIDPAPGEVIGPAGPTTSRRMDPYTPRLLREQGLAGTIGKSERGEEVVEAIRETGTVYLVATGGAAYLQARSVRAAQVLAWPELGTEALRALDVVDFPAIVAVDSTGTDLHRESRLTWAASPSKRNPEP